MIFEFFQMGVDEAVNGKMALQMFLEGFEKSCGCVNRAYKLIIMDLQMPVMGGIQSSKEIIKLVRSDMQL